jgi:hypothetical protein
MQKFVKFIVNVYPTAMERSLMKGLTNYQKLSVEECEKSEPLLCLMNQLFNET